MFDVKGDGIAARELRPLPVLPGRMHLAQSKFVTLKDRDRRELTFADMAADDDPSLIHDQLVVTVDAQLFYSVLNALQHLASRAEVNDWVLVHDAARPFASPDLTERVIEAAREHGASEQVRENEMCVAAAGHVAGTDRHIRALRQGPGQGMIDVAQRRQVRLPDDRADDHGNRCRLRIRLKRAQQLPAIHVWEHDIQQDDCKRAVFDHRQSFLAT